VFRVGNFEAEFEVERLLFAPLRHYAIYAYLLSHLNLYFSDRTLRALRHQKTRSRRIKCAIGIPPT